MNNFLEIIKNSFYLSFSKDGRSSRKELVLFGLFTVFISTTISIIASTFDGVMQQYFLVMLAAFAIIITPASFSLMTRRLHDTGKSGWWFFLTFTVIGIIPLLYFLFKKSAPEENNYGKQLQENSYKFSPAIFIGSFFYALYLCFIPVDHEALLSELDFYDVDSYEENMFNEDHESNNKENIDVADTDSYGTNPFNLIESDDHNELFKRVFAEDYSYFLEIMMNYENLVFKDGIYFSSGEPGVNESSGSAAFAFSKDSKELLGIIRHEGKFYFYGFENNQNIVLPKLLNEWYESMGGE